MPFQDLLKIVLVLALAVFASSCEKDPWEDDDTDLPPSDSTIDDAVFNNCEDHEKDEDYIWNASNVTYITFNGSSITVNGTGASVNGTVVTITAAGNYSFTGSLPNGRIIVNNDDVATVRLIFNNINLKSTDSAPVYVASASKVIIILPDETENYITDGTSYSYDDPADEEPNAAVFSTADITLYGKGTLFVDGNFNDGISGKDGLIIRGPSLNVTSVDDGIRGKDYLVVKEGNITVNAGGDGLKSDNDNDTARGYVRVDNGVLGITSGGDAISAVTDVLITTGSVEILSGKGASVPVTGDISEKGIKAGVDLIIDDGLFSINSSDDALHCNTDITINGGEFTLSSGDDGMHAEEKITLNDGTVNILKCYEGIEAQVITNNSADISVTASDDGINAVPMGASSQGGPPGTMSGSSADNFLHINGGYIYVNANGDGIDINGSVTMTAGYLVVNGPVANDNGAIDYDGTFKISGGYVVAAGSSGMSMAPGTGSEQNSLLLNYSTVQKAGTLIHIKNKNGDEILTFAPVKNYQSVAFSSSSLLTGSSYDVYSGGSSTGEIVNGLYINGTYTPGTLYTDFTVTALVTKIGTGGGGPPHP